MKHLMAAAALLLLVDHAAASGPPSATTEGHGGLALAFLVGTHSPAVKAATKAELLLLIDDKPLPAGDTALLHIDAKSVVCRAGDVDLAAFSCVLTYGKKTVTFSGRAANELFATLIEAGVQSDGAAGTIYEAVHALVCTLDPVAIAGKSGGGVSCTYVPGPGT